MREVNVKLLYRMVKTIVNVTTRDAFVVKSGFFFKCVGIKSILGWSGIK